MRKPSKLEQQLAVLHGSPSPDEVRAAMRSKNGLLIAAAVPHAETAELLLELRWFAHGSGRDCCEPGLFTATSSESEQRGADCGARPEAERGRVLAVRAE